VQNKETVETKIKEEKLIDFETDCENRTFSDDSLEKYSFGFIELQKSIIDRQSITIEKQESRINDLESKICDYNKLNEELKKLQCTQFINSTQKITSEQNNEILKNIQKQIENLKPQGDIEIYPPYLILEQAVKLLNISKRKFQEYVKNGVLPPSISPPNSNTLNGGGSKNIGNKIQRWEKRELLEWWHGYKSI